jgi:hypothetical protein
MEKCYLLLETKKNNQTQYKNTVSENPVFNKIVQCNLNNTVRNLAEDSIFELTDTQVIKHHVLKPLLTIQHRDVQFKNMTV